MPQPSFSERLEEKLHHFSVALLVIWVVLLGFRPMMDHVDLGWHVAQGRWMVQHLAFYHHDALNYPNLGHALVDEYPLFQLILYAAWSLGWWGPCLLAAGGYGLLVWLLLRAGKDFDLHRSALLGLTVGLMVCYLQIVFPLRPHLATYLGIAILGLFLLRHRDATDWTRFWPMALLQIAWTNAHSGFVVGPAMVGLFGAEMVIRKWIATRAFPGRTMQTWLAAFVLILLACFINPYGWWRFYPPFFQDQLESIRAYVGEMQPLASGLAGIYHTVTILTLTVLALGLVARRMATSYAFLILTCFFYLQAISVQKAWPVFGEFVPLVVLASGAFARTLLPRSLESRLNALGHFVIAAVIGVALLFCLDSPMMTSLQFQWRECDRGRSELSFQAADWMQAHHLDGRLFHRCEDGGVLQMDGFDRGQVYADTGFGKYDADFIHEIGVVNERPTFLAHYLAAYRPDFVICGTFCYRWPYYLRQNGWRPIFYTPNSSVWITNNSRADFPTVSPDHIAATFEHDLVAYQRPKDIGLFGRNLIALNSMGVEDYAFAKLTGLPENDHHSPWYWEAARFMCFTDPPFSAAHRDALLREAEQLQDDAVTGDFRAHAHYATGDSDGAQSILEKIPPGSFGDSPAELLLKIYLDRHRPEALALARNAGCFDLRNGRHWMYLAQVEEQSGHIDAARAAWKKAVFYYPDDTELIGDAGAFAAAHGDQELIEEIANRDKVYGHDALPWLSVAK